MECCGNIGAAIVRLVASSEHRSPGGPRSGHPSVGVSASIDGLYQLSRTGDVVMARINITAHRARRRAKGDLAASVETEAYVALRCNIPARRSTRVNTLTKISRRKLSVPEGIGAFTHAKGRYLYLAGKAFHVRGIDETTRPPPSALVA